MSVCTTTQKVNTKNVKIIVFRLRGTNACIPDDLTWYIRQAVLRQDVFVRCPTFLRQQVLPSESMRFRKAL